MKIEINQLKCQRCGHQWTPRKSDVRMCPKCKSVLWDKPRKENEMRTLETILNQFANPQCDHPGCHEFYGSDDAREELKGTQYEGNVNQFVSDTLKRADAEENQAKKLALLDMAEAAILGEGFQDACRRFRVACLH